MKSYLPKIQYKKFHYYVFETVQTQYYNKNGKLVSYTRTARVDKYDIVENIIIQLQTLVAQYLLHRFFVVNFQCHGKTLTEYSQNVAFTEKKQVQSAHFSGRQHTLHNIVIQNTDGNALYVYHLSDTSHDSVMTFHITWDIIKYHSEVIEWMTF